MQFSDIAGSLPNRAFWREALDRYDQTTRDGESDPDRTRTSSQADLEKFNSPQS